MARVGRSASRPSRAADIQRLFDETKKAFGTIDVLVNNAGIATHRETEDISLDYWRAALDINITAPFRHSRP
jgi:3-oxoacyl-[acyl-carrier protein] reductase